MSIQWIDRQDKGVFAWVEAGERLAEMEHTWAGEDKFIIDHTMVDDTLRGQGIGRKLLDATVQYARDQQVKIIPLCPFAHAMFRKDSSLADVWYTLEQTTATDQHYDEV